MADGTLRKLRMSHSPVNGADYCGEGTGHFRSSGEQIWKSIWNTRTENYCVELIGPMSTPQYSMSLACVRAAETMPSHVMVLISVESVELNKKLPQLLTSLLA